jgi:hypothetical protein
MVFMQNDMNMKKCYLLVGLLIGTIGVQAQFSKGQKMLSGNIQFNHSSQRYELTNQNDWKSRQGGAGLEIGYNIFRSEQMFDRYSLFIGQQYNSSESGINPNKYNSTIIGVAYTRTRLFPFVGKLKLTLGTGVQLSFNTIHTESAGIKGNGFGMGITGGVTPGIVYPLNNRILLSMQFNNLLSVYYNYTKTGRTSATVNDEIRHSVGFSAGTNAGTLSSFGLGAYWLLRK